MRAITRAQARVFGGINFGDLVKNSPIRQIKIPAKVSGYTVAAFIILATHLLVYLGLVHDVVLNCRHKFELCTFFNSNVSTTDNI